MHGVRQLCVALGLLVCGVQMSPSPPSLVRTCRNNGGFDDVASKTLIAGVVVEARAVADVRRTACVIAGQAETCVQFDVKQTFKGDLRSPGRSSPPRRIVVGPFGGNASDEAGVCRAAAFNVRLRPSFLLFLTKDVANSSAASSSNASSPHHVVHLLSSPPVPSSKAAVEEARSYSCASCGEAPTVRLSPAKPKSVKKGHRLKLTCRVTGRPMPRHVTWFRNGEVLTPDQKSGIKIIAPKKARQRPSTHSSWLLQIRSTEFEHAGEYSCQAANVIGTSKIEKVDVTITVSSRKTCPKELSSYCINGGTCFVLTALKKHLCLCEPGYRGLRCEEKELAIPDDFGDGNMKVGRYRKRKKRMHGPLK